MGAQNDAQGGRVGLCSREDRGRSGADTGGRDASSKRPCLSRSNSLSHKQCSTGRSRRGGLFLPLLTLSHTHTSQHLEPGRQDLVDVQARQRACPQSVRGGVQDHQNGIGQVQRANIVYQVDVGRAKACGQEVGDFGWRGLCSRVRLLVAGGVCAVGWGYWLGGGRRAVGRDEISELSC